MTTNKGCAEAENELKPWKECAWSITFPEKGVAVIQHDSGAGVVAESSGAKRGIAEEILYMLAATLAHEQPRPTTNTDQTLEALSAVNTCDCLLPREVSQKVRKALFAAKHGGRNEDLCN